MVRLYELPSFPSFFLNIETDILKYYVCKWSLIKKRINLKTNTGLVDMEANPKFKMLRQL